MQYRYLGATDLRVSELGFGAFAIGGNRSGNSYGPTDDAESIRAIHRALELGCTLFDTADVYGWGHSETLLGRALAEAGRRDDVVVATKGGCPLARPEAQDFSRAHLFDAVDASLRRLRRDAIDLYQLHNPPLALLREGGLWDTLDALRRAGKIRHAGVSVHTVDEGLACLGSATCSSIQIVHNVFSLLRPTGAIEALFDAARAAGIGVIAREPLANGFLAGRRTVHDDYGPGDIRIAMGEEVRRVRVALARHLRPDEGGPTPAQLALRYVLDEPGVTATIVGIKSESQAVENFAAPGLGSFASLYAAHVVRGGRGP